MRMTLLTAALFSASLNAADSSAGKDLYDKSCKSCHGADGAPNAAVAKMMKVEMKDLKSTTLSDADIKKVITSGQGKMKPVASVAAGSVDGVVAHVRSLK